MMLDFQHFTFTLILVMDRDGGIEHGDQWMSSKFSAQKRVIVLVYVSCRGRPEWYLFIFFLGVHALLEQAPL